MSELAEAQTGSMQYKRGHAMKSGISKAELDFRSDRIRLEMKTPGLDGVLVYSPAWRRENFQYVTGTRFSANAGIAYLPKQGGTTAFAFSIRDQWRIREARLVEDARLMTLDDLSDVVDRILSDFGVRRIGIAGSEFMPEIVRQELARGLRDIELVSASSILETARLVKSDWELSCLRESGRICDAAWQTFLSAIRPGVREFEIVAEVEGTLRDMGADDNFMLIASGGDEVRGMSPPSDRKIRAGDMVRTELTPQWSGYWTQICRTAVVGEASAKQRESFELFEKSLMAGLSVVRDGVTAHEIAKAENDVFRSRGFGDYCTSEYTRVRGHCLGLHLDEYPIIEGQDTVLRTNSVLVVHPNTFTPLAGYHVLGDPVVVTENGFEKLLTTERALDEIDFA